MSTTSPDFHFTILSQLLQIVTSNAVGRTEFSLRIDPEDPAAGSMQEQLLAGVLDGTIRSDEEAALKLYSAGPSDQRYMTLRSRCIDRLLNEVRHIDLTYNQLSEYSTNVLRCIDLLRSGYLLSFYGSSDVATYAMKRALSISQKYDLTAFELITRRELASSAVLTLDVQINKSHNDVIKRLIRRFHLEQVAIQSHESLLLLDTDYQYEELRSDEPRPANLSEMLDFLDSVDSECSSYTFILNRFRYRFDYYMAALDFHSASNVVSDALSYFKEHSHLVSISRLGEFNVLQLELQIKTRSELDRSNIINPAHYFTTGNINWCVSNTLTAYKHLYHNHYPEAIGIYRELKSKQTNTHVGGGAYEHRMLLEAYLWILTKILPASEFGHPDPSSLFSFRESTFLNSMSLLTEHKKGTNALVVIAHAFILLIQNKEREAFRRISYLNVYATRYFKGETEQRLWHCVKAMQKIPTFRARPHMMRDAMAPAIDRIRRLSDLPMKHGFNELVQWDVLLEAYIAWEIERVSRQRQ
jgi:hypothetical protein